MTVALLKVEVVNVWRTSEVDVKITVEGGGHEYLTVEGSSVFRVPLFTHLSDCTLFGCGHNPMDCPAEPCSCGEGVGNEQ